MSQPVLRLMDYLEKAITDMERAIIGKDLGKTESAFERFLDFSNYLKELLPKAFIQENFENFDRHVHFIKRYLKEKDFEWIESNFNDIKERDFPSLKLEIYSLIETEQLSEKKPVFQSKNVFIVHGRDIKPLTQLKSILEELRLNPIILHEQPGGSRTIPEKLERYSDVGYAFVILTPDDIGVSFQELFEKTARSSYEDDALRAARRILDQSKGSIERFIEFNDKFMQDPADASKFLQFLVPRARQNVILEFGYFMGLLGREKVCCLYKADVELPSDMHGIVYLLFKDSVDEAKDMIIKELKAAGYTI
jgi:predicted nucleotide-binding protein